MHLMYLYWYILDRAALIIRNVAYKSSEDSNMSKYQFKAYQSTSYIYSYILKLKSHQQVTLTFRYYLWSLKQARSCSSINRLNAIRLWKKSTVHHQGNQGATGSYDLILEAVSPLLSNRGFPLCLKKKRVFPIIQLFKGNTYLCSIF